MYTYNWSMWHAVWAYIFVNLSAVLIVYLSQRRLREEEKEEQELSLSAMKRLVQLVNIAGRRPQDVASAAGQLEMVEITPITVM
jgi:hypothetical protein